MTRRQRAQRPWVHLDTTPLFDQTNGTRGATAAQVVPDPGTSATLRLVELGVVSSIITFGTGIS
ncbi:hypothetical protein QDR37_04800 [Amnibacterium sp. CER49]|uniref:hypothetical protein n=1 Tax=Amnibacterium sp. CER49 TaxID=3039161 RepID=UPI00244B5CEB|nr:hypothetical protein [Amnibacterium sp. CER49]MDH2443260.1 hypothetical protein [Amnibacterium sp. CER49]